MILSFETDWSEQYNKLEELKTGFTENRKISLAWPEQEVVPEGSRAWRLGKRLQPYPEYTFKNSWSFAVIFYIKLDFL